MKVKEQIKYDVAIYMFKFFHQVIPRRVIHLETVGRVHERNTRQANDLLVPRTRTKLADRAISVRGPVLWNALPSYVREVNSISIFKRKLKYFLQTEDS